MSSPGFGPWSTPRWVGRKKHAPPARRKPWEDVVRETGQRFGNRGGWAKYARDLPMPIEDLELGCLDEDYELPAEGPVRRFYREMPFVVGASNGEETHYVYVEWHNGGHVHGRPITLAELIARKGLPE